MKLEIEPKLMLLLASDAVFDERLGQHSREASVCEASCIF